MSAGIEINAPGEEACALILALHAASHGRGWARPTIDLERATERVDMSVWEAAAALAQDLAAAPAFAVGLRRCPGGRHVADALGLSTEGVPRPVRVRASASGAPVVIDWLIGELLTGRGVRARLTFLAREILPTRQWMLEAVPFAGRGPGWLLGAYLVRLIRLAKMVCGGLPAWVRAALPRQSEIG